jgi:SAM-dependent methyltransferase
LRIPKPDTDWELLNRQLEQITKQLPLRLESLTIDTDDYFNFKRRCWPGKFYAVGYKDKKILEHYLAFRLLGLQKGQTYIDVASENSPYPGLFRNKCHVKAFSQDLTYKPGVHGDRIGSSAESIPVPDSSVDAISLQCAFEHFANNVDTGFVSEVARILKPGGRCVIAPLYLGSTHLNIVCPALDYSWVEFDEGALPIGERHLGGTFERIYSPAALRRILIPGLKLNYTLFRIYLPEVLRQAADNLEAISRVRYALQITKEPAGGRKD